MKYYVVHADNKWVISEAKDKKYTKPYVTCMWHKDETLRSYTTHVYADDMGEALTKGKSLILAYIEEHRNPLTTLTEVVNGEASFRPLDEIIHELCRAVLDHQGIYK